MKAGHNNSYTLIVHTTMIDKVQILHVSGKQCKSIKLSPRKVCEIIAHEMQAMMNKFVGSVKGNSEFVDKLRETALAKRQEFLASPSPTDAD